MCAEFINTLSVGKPKTTLNKSSMKFNESKRFQKEEFSKVKLK